jgi:3-oxoacyl-[acyl-carrier-protein] synthase-1
MGVSEARYRQQLQQQDLQQHLPQLERQQLQPPSANAELAVPMGIIGYGKLAQSLGQQFALSPHRYTYSTACTSSSNALLYAHRLLQAGVIDHALVLGIEFFNHTTLLGFYGLGLISPSQSMRPFSAGRDGLMLGEGCGLLLLSRDASAARMHLCGGAVATDNHSLTAANIDGSSLAAVIGQALADSAITAADIVAVKAHGTASMLNDEAEAAGLRRVFAETAMPPIFALKPFCGHSLGASGALEMALTIGCLERELLPANPQLEDDSALGIRLLHQSESAPIGHYLFNCFAFGGNNNALILRREG